MPTTDVVMAAQLAFARGKVGQRYPLNTDEEKAAFAKECAEHTLPLTLTNTADCGDDRVTIALGDGTNDPNMLRARIAPQLFGGLFLATAKALIEADAAIIKDATSVWQVYETVDSMLSPRGFNDAAHQNCGAEKMVESSVENQLALEAAVGATTLLFGDDGGNRLLLTLNTETKRRRLNDGFYGDWDTEKRKARILERTPSNYSFLKENPEDSETNGHDGSGLYAVTQKGMGYQKTGRAFGVTVPTMFEISELLGGSAEERRRILLGFGDDTAHVGAGLVTENFPVFAQAA